MEFWEARAQMLSFGEGDLLLHWTKFLATFWSDLDLLQAYNNLDTGQKCKVQNDTNEGLLYCVSTSLMLSC